MYLPLLHFLLVSIRLKVGGETFQRVEEPTLLTPFDLALADIVADKLRLQPQTNDVVARMLDYLKQRQDRPIHATLALDVLRYIQPGGLRDTLVRNLSLSAPPRSDERYVRLLSRGLPGGMEGAPCDLKGRLLEVLTHVKLEGKIDAWMAYCDEIGAEEFVDLQEVDPDSKRAYYLELIDHIEPKKIQKGKMIERFNQLFLAHQGGSQQLPPASPAPTLPAPPTPPPVNKPAASLESPLESDSSIAPIAPNPSTPPSASMTSLPPSSLASSASNAGSPQIEELDSMIASAATTPKPPTPTLQPTQAPHTSEGGEVGSAGQGSSAGGQKKERSQLGIDIRRKYDALKSLNNQMKQEGTHKDKKRELRYKMVCELASPPSSDKSGSISLKDVLRRTTMHSSLDEDGASEMNRLVFHNDGLSLVSILAEFVKKKEPEKSDFELIWPTLWVLSQLWLCLLRTESEEVCAAQSHPITHTRARSRFSKPVRLLGPQVIPHLSIDSHATKPMSLFDSLVPDPPPRGGRRPLQNLHALPKISTARAF